MMNCPICGNKVKFLKNNILIRKCYCENCGYSFKKRLFGKKIEGVIIVGTINKNYGEKTIIFENENTIEELKKWDVNVEVKNWKKYNNHERI